MQMASSKSGTVEVRRKARVAQAETARRTEVGHGTGGDRNGSCRTS